MKMRQIDASKARFRVLGVLWTVAQTTFALFGIVMLVLSAFGFYTLVYFRYFPNFWVFLGMLVVIFAGLAVFSYMVLIPTTIGFANRQHWLHDSPARAEIEAIHGDIKRILTKLGLKPEEEE